MCRGRLHGRGVGWVWEGAAAGLVFFNSTLQDDGHVVRGGGVAGARAGGKRACGGCAARVWHPSHHPSRPPCTQRSHTQHKIISSRRRRIVKASHPCAGRGAVRRRRADGIRAVSGGRAPARGLCAGGVSDERSGVDGVQGVRGKRGQGRARTFGCQQDRRHEPPTLRA